MARIRTRTVEANATDLKVAAFRPVSTFKTEVTFYDANERDEFVQRCRLLLDSAVHPGKSTVTALCVQLSREISESIACRIRKPTRATSCVFEED